MDTRLPLVKAIMTEFVSKGSAELLIEHLAEDAIYKATAPVGTPIHEPFVGREGVIEYFRRCAELFTTESVEVTDYFESGEKVVVIGTECLHSHKAGIRQNLDWATVITFRGDRIANVLVIEDLSITLAAP